VWHRHDVEDDFGRELRVKSSAHGVGIAEMASVDKENQSNERVGAKTCSSEDLCDIVGHDLALCGEIAGHYHVRVTVKGELATTPRVIAVSDEKRVRNIDRHVPQAVEWDELSHGRTPAESVKGWS